jgi:adenine-specific DNA-methyltransferase
LSRLTELLARLKLENSQLGADLEREVQALSSRRAFGLNFERHQPEAVELSGRAVRKGDKVRIQPPRGSTTKGDQRLWIVKAVEKQIARLDLIDAIEPETAEAPIEDLVVVAEFRDYIFTGLISTGRVERGGDKPFHTVINSENFHAL